ncbi:MULTISPECIES: Der GTPase-activating protein YihI [Tatumella]|uniref:Der GTPase-activating protein YihI n=1 Tax=Tatumella punctata TaxID=399969 RepID=A0ABW1VK05_9GAMM|nr:MULTISPECIES: Der GTPase-activating protein YihI [unclassified Tatumella]MBS0857522.1 Der GTPase-activating protein YihI [Tatumella sp. JGM16]MBS0876565.1 Der GTPase-activating protein YihI [Tatumella sp. JGM82]MBS0890048.1 Der GTPase-activating protein YihI [Tatumella sp. JGM94]MBS0893089.1 Der GTPase-activating protein YihI [Tatumella sp. JGM130]MBS0901292.1 Der GTPase-activating protein YihI [Tatumella sp. JGM100]
MKQPAKSPRGKSADKRKTRAELNMEGRDRQRQKKRKGLSSGNRSNPDAQQSAGKRSGKQAADPRLGSKTPVPLVAAGPVAAKPALKPREAAPALSARDELDALENNPRLDALLDRLENGEKLATDDQAWLDSTLDRIEVLMEKLGIDLDDGSAAEDPEAEEDMYRLLKGN